jgi:hypothetical protein
MRLLAWLLLGGVACQRAKTNGKAGGISDEVVVPGDDGTLR